MKDKFYRFYFIEFLFLRCALHDLTQLNIFRQKDIVQEIYHYVFPIVTISNDEYLIGNIKLPHAEDKIYQTLSLLKIDYFNPIVSLKF